MSDCVPTPQVGFSFFIDSLINLMLTESLSYVTLGPQEGYGRHTLPLPAF